MAAKATKKLTRVPTNSTESLVKISDLMSPEFQLALAEVMNSNDLSIETSWALLQVFESVTANQKHYEELRSKLLSKFGKKGPDGTILTNENKTEFLLEDKAGFDKEYAELLNLRVQLKQVSLNAVKGVKLSPAKLSSLVKTVVNPSL